MEADEARRVLGVGRGVSSEQLRTAYRARLRATHPDLHGGPSAATAAVVDAYRVLAGLPADRAPDDVPDVPDEPPRRPSPRPGPVPGRRGPVVVDGDTVAAELPTGDLFALLVAAGDAMGDVTHADPESGLLEVIVQFPGYGPCSVLLSLQPRRDAESEATCTVETLSGGPPPPTAVMAELLGAGLRAVLAARAEGRAW